MYRDTSCPIAALGPRCQTVHHSREIIASPSNAHWQQVGLAGRGRAISVKALALPPCDVRKESYSFSSGNPLLRTAQGKSCALLLYMRGQQATVIDLTVTHNTPVHIL